MEDRYVFNATEQWKTWMYPIKNKDLPAMRKIKFPSFAGFLNLKLEPSQYSTYKLQ